MVLGIIVLVVGVGVIIWSIFEFRRFSKRVEEIARKRALMSSDTRIRFEEYARGGKRALRRMGVLGAALIIISIVILVQA